MERKEERRKRAKMLPWLVLGSAATNHRPDDPAGHQDDGTDDQPNQQNEASENQPSIGGAGVPSDYPVIEHQGDEGPYTLATRRGPGGPSSIAWVQEGRAVFRSDAHDLVVAPTDSPNVYRMTIEEYESAFDG